MPRGLPDSVVYTAVKRASRRSRGRKVKDEKYYQDVSDIMNAWVARRVAQITRLFDKKK
jgi:hypothetical protein